MAWLEQGVEGRPGWEEDEERSTFTELSVLPSCTCTLCLLVELCTLSLLQQARLQA